MYDDDTLGWLLFFGLIWNVLSFLVPVAAVILIVWLVRRSQQAGPSYRAQAFDPSFADLEQLIRTLARSQGNLSPGQRQQISSAFLRAQADPQHMDDIRRQQSETRLNGMRSEAASLGIFDV